jgi:zinc/manganese transport system substrate-binding protein
MKTIRLLALTLCAQLFAGGVSAQDKIRVVATTPDLAALAREIGGGAVDVVALAKPTEDPHFVDAKPSLIVTLNRADVLIEGGAELEIGWLPALLQSARNTKIAVGAPGRISASRGIRMMDVPATLDRSRGDVHGLGNPHFLLDPANVKLVVAQMAEHFAQVAPGAGSIFQANLARFNATLDARVPRWQGQLAPYRGMKVVTYHSDFAYLARTYGLEVIAALEPKPGIAPSPAHLAQVIGTMKTAGAKVILVQPFQNRRTAETVARQTEAAVVMLPHQPGVSPGTDGWFELMDHTITTLAAALGAAR